MKRVTLTEALTMAAAVVFLIMTAGTALAQPQVSDVDLGAVSHNQPDDVDMGVSYTLMGADATRTAVAWYRDGSPVMDLYMVYEGDASNALLDLSGNGQIVVASGEVTAATAWSATAGHGGSGAYLYSATSGNRFYLNAGSVMNTAAYTKALWLQRTGTSSSHNILSSNTVSGYHVMYAGGSAANKVTAFHVGQSPKVADPVTLVNGVWYHYAVTYQASDGAMIMYRNGVQVASGTATPFSDQSLLIGSFTGGAGNQWEGYLDDVRIYDHVLSPEQILALYNGSDTIRAQETTVGEDWYAEITPSSSTAMGTAVQSNTLTIATDPPIVGDIPGEVVIEDAAFAVINLDTYVTDADHADNQIAWTYTGNTDLTVDITAGQATMTAPGDWFGSETITFRATDPLGNYNEDAATFEATSVNDPPTVANPIADVAATEDDPPIDNYADLNVVFTDVEDAGNLNFAVVSNTNPTLVDVTIDGTDQLDLSFFSGQNGTATVVISATDLGSASVEDTFMVNVTANNTPPVVNSPIVDVAVNEDNPAIDNYVDLNAVFTDAEDGDALAFQVLTNTNQGLVTVTIGASDSALDLTFTPDASGSATITIRATDSGTDFVDDIFTIDVAAVNDVPVVATPIADVAATEDDPAINNYVDLNAVFSDIEDGDALAFQVLTNTNPGLVTVTIGASDSALDLTFAPNLSGTATITIRATDSGTDFVDDVFTIDVTPVNDVPVVVTPIADVAATEDDPAIDNYVDLNTVFSDIEDGDVLAFQVLTNTNPGLVTVTIGASDSALDLTFAPNLSGTATITIRATDSGTDFVDDIFTIDVTAVNDVPVVATPIADVVATEDDPAIDNYVDLNTVFSDIEDGDVLAFQVLTNTNPSLVSVTIGASDSALDLTFTPDASGSAIVTIRATDSGTDFVDDIFTIDVAAVNDVPVVATPIADVAATEDDPAINNYVDLNAVFSDIEDGDALAFQVLTNTNPGLVTVTIGAADSALDLSYAPDASGSAVVTIRATDSQLDFVDDVFTVDVAAVNDVPVVANPIANAAATEDDPPIDNYVDLNTVFSDIEDGDALDFQVLTNTNPGLVTVTIGTTDSALDLSFTPDASGTATITIRATDGDLAFVDDVLMVDVAAVNDVPVVANPIADVAATEDDPPIDNYADLNFVFTDVEDAGNLSFAVISNTNPTLVDVVIDGTDMLDFSFFAGQFGTATVTIRATDTESEFVEDVFLVVVNAVNEAPVLAPIAPQTVDEGVELSFAVLATDADSPAITLTGDQFPTGAVLSDNGDGSGTFTWTPPHTYQGLTTVLIIAVDDSLASDTEIVDITVVDVPALSTPTLTASSASQLETDSLFCNYSLIPNADRAATAWYRDGIPILDLYMVYEGGASNALLDLSGNGHTVTAAGTVTPASAWDATGGHDGSGAYLFGTGASRFYLDAGSILNTQGYTKACWLKSTAATTSRNVLSGSVWPGGGHVMFASGSVGGKMSAGHDGVTTVVQDNVNGTLTLDQWYHYAVTFDGTSGQMILYANGIAVDTGTAGPVTDSSVLIGSLTTGAGNEWPGYLDDVRVYDHVLSPEQIAALHDLANPLAQNTIVPEETQRGEVWSARVTPFSDVRVGPDSTTAGAEIYFTNLPPIFSPVPTQSINQGLELVFVVEASDPDSQIPSLSAAQKPWDASFVDNQDGTGTFTWTPLGAGTYHAKFVATDDSLATDTEVVQINVAFIAAGPPVLMSPPILADSILYDHTPEFIWTQWVKPQADTSYYLLELAETEDFSNQTVVDSILDTSYTWTSSLPPGVQFWWRVTAYDDLDTVLSSNVLSFYTFVHGDMSHSHDIEISDLVYLIGYMFKDGPAADPWYLADLNGDCGNDIADLVRLVDFMFRGGTAPIVCPTVK